MLKQTSVSVLGRLFSLALSFGFLICKMEITVEFL